MSQTNEKNDVLLKAISKNADAVIYALDATALVQESMDRLQSWPPATKHLGQAMMASILLQALTEASDNESVSLQWMCAGPFGHLYTEAKNYGESRGTIQNPHPPVEDYETGMGSGILQVRRTRNGRTTTGIVNAIGSVSSDIVEYLEQSEQRSCGMNLSVQIEWADEQKTKFRVRSALGYVVHILPQNTEQKMNEVLWRWDQQMLALGPISQWGIGNDTTAYDMIRLLTNESAPEIVLQQRIKFHCNCSEERAARALSLLSNQEKKEGSVVSDEAVEIHCEYCGRIYTMKPKTETPKKTKGKKK